MHLEDKKRGNKGEEEREGIGKEKRVAVLSVKMRCGICSDCRITKRKGSTSGKEGTVAHNSDCESILRRFPRPVIYGAIQINSPDTILGLVPPEMLVGKIVQKAFHVTTIYIGGRCTESVDPVLLEQLASLLGKSITVTLTRIVSDPKGTAIAVRNEGEFPCANAHPHITIANAKNVSAKYSNELLDDSHAGDPDRVVLDLPSDTRVTGTFEFVFG